MTYVIPADAKRPTNSYEASAWIFRYGKPKSVHAFAVAMALAFFWNMDGKSRRCNPSIAAIMEKTGIKSKATVLKALKELEDLGEWVVSHSKGHARNYYFPMFVEGANADRLAGIEEQRVARKEAMKAYKTNAELRNTVADIDSLDALSETTEGVLCDEPTQMLEPVEDPSAESAVQVAVSKVATDVDDPKVVTERDAEIREAYQLIQEHKSSDDYEWDFPVPEGATVIDVVDDAAWIMLKDYRNAKGLFVAGSEDVFQGEMPGRWMNRFGKRYGKTFTYSYIHDIYDNFAHQPFEVQDRVDAAMFVLGHLSKAPSLKFLNALLFRDFNALDPEAQELRALIDNTVGGRELTRRYTTAS